MEAEEIPNADLLRDDPAAWARVEATRIVEALHRADQEIAWLERMWWTQA